MSTEWPDAGIRQDQLRLWPGVAAVALQWLGRFGLPVIAPEATMFAVIGGLAGGLVVLIWWLAFSRAASLERWGAAALMAAGLALTPRLLDKSIATGFMGLMFPLYAIPVLSLALVAWAVVSRRLSTGPRRTALVAAILAACGGWTLVRTDGMIGEASSQFAWRWTKTPEERLLVRVGAETLTPPAKPATMEPAPAPVEVKTPVTIAAPAAAVVARVIDPVAEGDWPGFRGPRRDSVSRGSPRIKTDWAASPPVELWRRPAGPGWSSFAVRGGLIYTQEQRGDFEIVACYKLATGEPVWTHRDAARFWESNGGAGPRGTPSLAGGRVYTLGATGILNALDAARGSLVWTRNVATDTGAKIPGWGFSSSPLVVDGSVIAAASGRLAAYGLDGGEPRWVVQTGGGSYSSPHMLTIDGVEQVVMLSGDGATSVAPVDGKVLWKHSWPGSTILQPALTADGGVLISTGGSSGGGAGTRRLAVVQGPSGWTAEERWTSTGLKPYFNDLVVHKDHAFGFDGTILSCIALEDGRRKWKGGRFGHGQMILLPDQDLLLVLSEEGELALVAAESGQFTELGRIRAMEGKTWNHPVLAGGILLVRNGEEMAAFRLQ